jgi:hypothetical protein
MGQVETKNDTDSELFIAVFGLLLEEVRELLSLYERTADSASRIKQHARTLWGWQHVLTGVLREEGAERIMKLVEMDREAAKAFEDTEMLMRALAGGGIPVRLRPKDGGGAVLTVRKHPMRLTKGEYALILELSRREGWVSFAELEEALGVTNAALTSLKCRLFAKLLNTGDVVLRHLIATADGAYRWNGVIEERGSEGQSGGRRGPVHSRYAGSG